VNSTPKLSVVERAWKYIDRMPRAISGAGGHDATFAVACRLVNGFGLSTTEALELLRRWNVDCQPPWSERDLIHKINTVPRERGGYLLDGTRSTIIQRPKPKRPLLDPTTATENFLVGYRATEAEIRAASPTPPGDDWRQGTALVFRTLYDPGEQVNVTVDYSEEDGRAKPKGYGLTQSREDWLTLIAKHGPPEDRGGAWFKMNPLDGQGIADTNVVRCRYALVEADKIPVELQLSLLVKLPLPIAAIFTSGGRSLHCLVRVDVTDASQYREIVGRMLQLLTKFGVDAANKNPSRGARLPGAQRIIGAIGNGQQRLIYLDPSPEQRPIIL